MAANTAQQSPTASLCHAPRLLKASLLLLPPLLALVLLLPGRGQTCPWYFKSQSSASVLLSGRRGKVGGYFPRLPDRAAFQGRERSAQESDPARSVSPLLVPPPPSQPPALDLLDLYGDALSGSLFTPTRNTKTQRRGGFLLLSGSGFLAR